MPTPQAGSKMDDPLVYYEEYKVIICKVHRRAIGRLKSHLQTHSELDDDTRREIAAKYSMYQLNSPTQLDLGFGPTDPIKAIDDLQIVDGFACREFRQCRYLTRSYECILRHCQKAHKWMLTQRDPEYWSEEKLQTFFLHSSGIRYFCVKVVKDPEGLDSTRGCRAEEQQGSIQSRISECPGGDSSAQPHRYLLRGDQCHSPPQSRDMLEDSAAGPACDAVYNNENVHDVARNFRISGEQAVKKLEASARQAIQEGRSSSNILFRCTSSPRDMDPFEPTYITPRF